MSKVFIISVLFSFLLIPLSSFSNEINDAARLRRISFLLNGSPPSFQDFKNLDEASSKEDFFDEIVDSYLASQDFVDKMEERLNELLRVRVERHDVDRNVIEDGVNIDNSMNLLFRDLISENQSWDVLLTKKQYKIQNEEAIFGSRSYSEAWFYAYNSGGPELVDEVNEYILRLSNGVEIYSSSYESSNGRVKIEPFLYAPQEQDSVDSLAGVLTTNRFFSRYPNTRLNKNRKRAAAVFRIFLCDAMTPAVLASRADNENLLNKFVISSPEENMSEMDTDFTNAQIADKHGTDPECNSCHYKLDPAADTFIGSGAFPNRTPSPGALVYRASNGDLIDIPVSGIGELGKVITQQHDYLTCQTQHFWDWFIGSDVPLDEDKKNSLALKFDELGRKPKDFIKHLINTEDFMEPDVIKLDDLRFSHVRSILKRCDSCHESVVKAPTLSESYPYSSNININSLVVGDIALASDLIEAEDDDYMPPSNAGWSLQGFERDLLKAWINGGAKDDNGVVQIDVDTLIGDRPLILDGHLREELIPEFGNNYYRYISNHDFFLSLNKLFPQVDSIRACDIQYGLDNSDKMTLGFLNPDSGRSLFVTPSPQYINFIKKCSRQVLDQVFNASSIKDFSNDLIIEGLTAEGVTFKLWSDLSAQSQREQVAKLIDYVIGFNVISFERRDELTEKYLSAITEYSDTNGSSLGVSEVLNLTITGLVTSSEFLVY